MNAQAQSLVDQALSRAGGFHHAIVRQGAVAAAQSTACQIATATSLPRTWHGGPPNIASHVGVGGEPMCRECIREHEPRARFAGDDPVMAGWIEEPAEKDGFCGTLYPRLPAGQRTICQWCVGE